MSEVAVKHDAGKRRMSLLPSDVLRGIADVMAFGVAKYAIDAWMDVPGGLVRYLDAMDRHRAAIECGEELDDDSPLPHAFHFACNALFAAWFMLHAPNERAAWRRRFDPRTGS